MEAFTALEERFSRIKVHRVTCVSKKEARLLFADDRGVRKPNGPTLLKRRLLAAAGWTVISVPFYELDGSTAVERQTYMERAAAPL